jgi:hypothetical protein
MEGGGYDTCEDLTEALKCAAKFDWIKNNDHRLLVIITDSPTHGSRYHSKDVMDDYLEKD